MGNDKKDALLEEMKNNPQFQQLRELAEAEARGAIKSYGGGFVQGQYVLCPECDKKNYFQAVPNATFGRFVCEHCGHDFTHKMNWMLDHMSRMHNDSVSN